MKLLCFVQHNHVATLPVMLDENEFCEQTSMAKE